MSFTESLALVAGLLALDKRVSYRRLRNEFALDDATIDDVRYELIVARRLALDESNEVLVWAGASGAAEPSGVSPRERLSADRLSHPSSTVRGEDTLPAMSARASRSEAANEPARAQRRQLTVMFCDLVGSTTLSTQLDPEDLQQVIVAYQDACREAIARYDGFIARYMGDGLLVYFGYPQAHENDPERAVRAGLDILGAMPRVNAAITTRYGADVAVRVGVATGPVVVGDIVGEGAAEEAAVVGETPNLAARLQGVAEPGQLAISPGTQRLVDELFDFEDLGERELKGIAKPIRVWRVIGERSEGDVSDVDARARSTPLVGRQEELGLLTRAWEGAREGRGQVVLIQGEAGVGKSRLLEALRGSVSGEAFTWISVRASPYHTASPLYPVAEQVKRALGWQAGDSADARLDKLERGMSKQAEFELEELVPLLASLLSLELPEGRYPQLNMTPKAQREATLDAISAWVLGLTENAPVLMAWEDLHWADPTTVELLGLMLDQVPTTRVLIIGTYRPDFVPPWPTRTHMTPITLSRLERPEVEAIVANQCGGKVLPGPVLEHIVAKADGVPLYVEELTRTILHSELLTEHEDCFELRGSLADVEIPETLQDSLMARLDRAPTLREVAQVGAVLGREFAYEVMKCLSPLDEPVLQDGLGQLVSGELLYQRGRGQRARYIFKHALIHDAAYQSLLRRTRQRYHAQVANLLEQSFPDAVRNNPELLAHHYSRSGQFPGKAGEFWERAADVALSRGADVEAVSHLNAALGEIARLEETHERHERELNLQTKLGPAVVATSGFADPRVAQCYGRAQELCEKLGDTTKLALILRGQQLNYQVSGDVQTARLLARQLVEVAEREGSASLRVGAYGALAQTNILAGRLHEGLECAERGVAIFDSAAQPVANWPGLQPLETCYGWAGLAHWLQGKPEEAIKCAEAAVEVARAGDRPFNLAFLLSLCALIPAWCGDYATVKRWAEESAALCRENRFEPLLDHNECLIAWCKAKEGGGVVWETLERAISGFEAHGVRGGHSLTAVYALYADCCLDAGDGDRGMSAIARGLHLGSQSNTRWLEAELLRLRGELRAGKTDVIEEAERDIQRAIDVARGQGARSLELRALESLVKVRSEHVGEAEARKALSVCYGKFTEGLETADLYRVRKMLAIGARVGRPRRVR